MKFLLGTQYFVYFAVRGIVLPFFNLFCRHLGFSGFQIGILSSVQTAAVVIFPVLWAMAADRFNARKSIFVLCTVMASVLWSLLFFTEKFLPVLFILALYSVFYAPIIAFLEAFAMDILGREKKKYGKSRVWGTISFIVVSLILGKVLSFYSTSIVIPLILAGMIVQSVFAFKMPDGKQQQPDHEVLVAKSSKEKTTAQSWSDFKAFFSLQTSLFLFAAFLMLVSHGAYYGFFSIYLESLGFGTSFIGFAWAVASLGEIVIMVGSNWIFSKFDLKKVLALSCGAASLRWLLLFTTSDSAPLDIFGLGITASSMILFSQLLHAFTYGSFHIASILAIDKLSLKGTTFGQAVNNAVTYGAGIMTGFFLSGIFYDDFQEYIFLASSVVALVGGVIIMYVRFDSKDIQSIF
ncbi:MAG: MFS transporter [Desulfamplus sp.]|nr:MFS transporter [Desulfamplus sp.]